MASNRIRLCIKVRTGSIDARDARTLGCSAKENRSMWIVTGLLLGTLLFAAGSVVYIIQKLHPIQMGKATSANLLLRLTVRNFFWWAALASSLVAGCCITGLWSGRL